jgi:hypothetical protein
LGELWTRSDPVRGVDRENEASRVSLAPYGSQFRRCGKRSISTTCVPSESGQAYVTLDPYGGVRKVPESEYIVVREVEDYLRYSKRWEDMREYTRDAPLTSETVGPELCALLESRQYHRHHGAELTRRIQGLEEQQRSKALLNQATAQTLRPLNTELNGLNQRFHHQAASGVEEMEGEVEETGGSGSRERTRTGL